MKYIKYNIPTIITLPSAAFFGETSKNQMEEIGVCILSMNKANDARDTVWVKYQRFAK